MCSHQDFGLEVWFWHVPCYNLALTTQTYTPAALYIPRMTPSIACTTRASVRTTCTKPKFSDKAVTPRREPASRWRSWQRQAADRRSEGMAQRGEASNIQAQQEFRCETTASRCISNDSSQIHKWHPRPQATTSDGMLRGGRSETVRKEGQVPSFQHTQVPQTSPRRRCGKTG